MEAEFAGPDFHSIRIGQWVRIMGTLLQQTDK
jgi:hypothetical protein